jgi:lysophospholipase L1-like esterase
MGYLVFLLVLLEVALRLAGGALLLARHFDRPAVEDAPWLRILAIGESTTFGWGIDPKNAYPQQLEKLIRDRLGIPVTVFNTGVPAQTSTSILRNIRYQIDQYRPQIVLCLFGTNDLNESLNDLGTSRAFGLQVPKIIAHLRLYRLACIVRDYALHAPMVEDHGAWIFFDADQKSESGDWVMNPEFLDQLEDNYSDILDTIQAAGAQPVVLSYLKRSEFLEPLFEDLGKREGVTYFQLHSPEVERSGNFNQDGFHPNEEGHRIMAEEILAGLLEARLIGASTQ